MKHYYLTTTSHTNCYTVYYSETKTDEQVRLEHFPNAERISAKEAERLCVEERKRRRENPMFSGYSPTVILPFEYYDWSQDSAMAFGRLFKRRYCLERSGK